jgi:hypothetical protein
MLSLDRIKLFLEPEFFLICRNSVSITFLLDWQVCNWYCLPQNGKSFHRYFVKYFENHSKINFVLYLWYLWYLVMAKKILVEKFWLLAFLWLLCFLRNFYASFFLQLLSFFHFIDSLMSNIWKILWQTWNDSSILSFIWGKILYCFGSISEHFFH